MTKPPRHACDVCGAVVLEHATGELCAHAAAGTAWSERRLCPGGVDVPGRFA